MRTPLTSRGAPRLALAAPLRHPPFRLLFAGQVVSNLGDWLDLLALLALVVYQWRLGAAALAALTLVRFVPQALLAPALGVLADRWPRRRVMIACDLGRAVVVLGLVWAPDLPTLLALLGGASVLSTLFGPARQAAVRLTVPEDDLLAANALSRLLTNVTKVLGPALGGVLVALVGPRAAFVADACSFLISAAILSWLPALDAALDTGDARSVGVVPRFWVELRAGLAHIAARRLLLVAVGAAVAEMFLVETNDSLSVLAFKDLGMTEAVVGLALAASGLGNVAGALGIGQWGQRVRPLTIMAGGHLLVGGVGTAIGLALMAGLTHNGPAWLPALVLGGVGFAAMWVAYGYVLQRETPSDLMGRVSATATGLYMLPGLAGPPLGAALAGRFGVGWVFAVTSAALIGLGLGVLAVEPRETREDDTQRRGEDGVHAPNGWGPPLGA